MGVSSLSLYMSYPFPKTDFPSTSFCPFFLSFHRKLYFHGWKQSWKEWKQLYPWVEGVLFHTHLYVAQYFICGNVNMEVGN